MQLSPLKVIQPISAFDSQFSESLLTDILDTKSVDESSIGSESCDTVIVSASESTFSSPDSGKKQWPSVFRIPSFSYKCRIYDIMQTNTTPYHPSGNPTAERIN